MFIVGVLVWVLIFAVFPIYACSGKWSRRNEGKPPMKNRNEPLMKNGDEPPTDRYCPYCRARLTKPNDCDICGKEFLRADALTETQVRNWGWGLAMKITVTRIVTVLLIVAASSFCLLFSMLNPVLWMLGTSVSCGFGALVATRSAVGTEKTYGHLAAVPLWRLKKSLACTAVGFVIATPFLFLFCASLN